MNVAATGWLRRHARWAGPLAALALLAGALVLLRRELRGFRYHEVVGALQAIPTWQALLALGATFIAFTVLAGYDALALRYIGRPLPLRRMMLGSSIAYGLSQTLGFPLVTGGAIRYRLWSAWGLTPAEIAAAMSFVGATFTLGVMAICGAALLLEPSDTLAALHLPVTLARATGVVLVALVTAYVAWSIVRRGRPVRVRGWEMEVPRPPLALAQLALGALDWTVAGFVLRALLPAGSGLPLLPFLGVFVIAQFAGLVSHVPGGLGVFEALMVFFLTPFMPADTALGALLAYRAIYYLIPFACALLGLTAYELRQHHERIAAVAAGGTEVMTRWGAAVLPSALSAATLLAGMVLLFSGATPSMGGRAATLLHALPLGVIELSHFTASVAGAALLVLAWAIHRRLDAAYGLTLAVLAVGAAASILKGLDWEEALLLAAVASLVAPARESFHRHAALTREPFSPQWTVAVLAVVGASVWLGLFSYQHVEYSGDLWWRFAARADAPRFLRASAGAAALLMIIGLIHLLRHVEAEPVPPTPEDLERAGRIARRSPASTANLVMLGDKSVLFSESGDGFLMYGVSGRSWVALGDPVGPPEARAELAWRFREEADRHGAWTVFYEVGGESLPLYVDLGLTLIKMGEEARVPLTGFSLEGSERKALRRAVRDVERSGATFRMVPAGEVDALLPEMRRVSDSWLADKRTREKGFSLGRFDERYLRRFPVALVRDAAGELVAFANVWANDCREELSVDLMRHTEAAPAGVMDYLFVQLMLWGREQGYGWFDFGMAPLSGFERRQLAPLWARAGGWLYRHGEHFYNFQGVRQYKEKFRPVWRPIYLAAPGGLALPRVLASVAALVSGGITGIVTR